MTTTNLNETERVKAEKDGLDVLQDLLRYSEQGDYDAIEAGDLAQRFKWFGVYRQKPNVGHFMLRIKIPGGQVTAGQLQGISELCTTYARGFGDITTRQTIQFHWVTIADIKPIFQRLAELGLNTQFSCGDTPRNVIGCPLAGVAKQEIIDSSAAVREVALMYQKAGKEFSNLPRKFKTSLGGCHLHCHYPQVNDVGFYGVKRPSGELGYGLLVGGGLSRQPMFAQPMRAFVRPDQVQDVCRAVAALFRDYGYREKRTRARLKFLVDDMGWQWTRDKLEEILGYELEHDESLLHPPGLSCDHMGVGEQKDGRFYVGVPIERGRWTARNMADAARLAGQYAAGEGRIRLTSKQNVLILDVPKENVQALCGELEQAGLPPKAHSLRDTLIACTGTEFCNLAVVETKHRAGRVLRWLEENVEVDFPLFVSFTGCPNACAQYEIADIGLTGTMTRDESTLDEKGKPQKVEGYNVHLGASMGSDPRFGEVIAKQVVADRIHLAIRGLIEHYKRERIDEEDSFQMWVSRSQPEHLQRVITEAVAAPEAEPLPA